MVDGGWGHAPLTGATGFSRRVADAVPYSMSSRVRDHHEAPLPVLGERGYCRYGAGRDAPPGPGRAGNGAGDSEPVLLYAHGGGWVLGDLETHDGLCRLLAATTGWAVLAVDYRRPPEFPYPAPFEDLDRALDWLHDRGAAHGLDPGRIAVGGDSAEAERYGTRLVEAGVPVICVRYQGMIHNFPRKLALFDAAPVAVAQIAAALRVWC